MSKVGFEPRTFRLPVSCLIHYTTRAGCENWSKMMSIFKKVKTTPLLAHEMYQHETHFSFTMLGSNMHPKRPRIIYFCKNGSWTSCTVWLEWHISKQETRKWDNRKFPTNFFSQIIQIGKIMLIFGQFSGEPIKIS